MSENADSLLFQLSNEVDSGMASPFIAKTWLSVLDDNSSNYASSMVTINTSQLANSNKWLSYSEGFLQVPMLITVTTEQVAGFAPATENSTTNGKNVRRPIAPQTGFFIIVLLWPA